MSDFSREGVLRQSTVISDDQAVQATNDDATSCKRLDSTADGILSYHCAGMQSRKVIGRTTMSISSANLQNASPQKLAEVGTDIFMNSVEWEVLCAGYYARVTAFRMLVEKFIRRTNKECQVISLGAGFDTLFWYLHSKSLCPALYLEVDFSSVVARKCHTIRYVSSISQWP